MFGNYGPPHINLNTKVKIKKKSTRRAPKIGGVWVFEGARLAKLPDYFHNKKAVTVCISNCGKYWYGVTGMADVKVGQNMPCGRMDENRNPIYIRIADMQENEVWEFIRYALKNNNLGPATSGFHPSVDQKCYCDKQQLMINGCVSARGEICPSTPKELL